MDFITTIMPRTREHLYFSMKTKLVMQLGVLLLFSMGLQGQKSKNNEVHRVWVSKVDNSKIINGLLYEANDESIQIIDKQGIKIHIDASNIGIIKIRRKRKVGNGILRGAMAGFGTGALIGFASGDDPDRTGNFFGEYTIEGTKAGQKALVLGIIGAFTGSGVGALIASGKEKISINGDINTYKTNLEKLRSIQVN